MFEAAIPIKKLHISALMGLNWVQMAYPHSAMNMAKIRPGMFSVNSSALSLGKVVLRPVKPGLIYLTGFLLSPSRNISQEI